jgi:hypothetical protein
MARTAIRPELAQGEGQDVLRITGRIRGGFDSKIGGIEGHTDSRT